MQKTGFLKLYHSLLRWEWYNDRTVMILFIHCLLKANYKDVKWKGILIKRGSFLTTYKQLQLELKMSKQELQTAIFKLKSTADIKTICSNKYSIICILKYSIYQTNVADSNTQNLKQIPDTKHLNKKNISNKQTIRKKYRKNSDSNKKNTDDIIANTQSNTQSNTHFTDTNFNKINTQSNTQSNKQTIQIKDIKEYNRELDKENRIKENPENYDYNQFLKEETIANMQKIIKNVKYNNLCKKAIAVLGCECLLGLTKEYPEILYAVRKVGEEVKNESAYFVRILENKIKKK